jgi:DNA-binding transcriptional LysR family regulator
MIAWSYSYGYGEKRSTGVSTDAGKFCLVDMRLYVVVSFGQSEGYIGKSVLRQLPVGYVMQSAFQTFKSRVIAVRSCVPSMRLDQVDLSLFLCVVDAGSITAGAREANLALASASERIRNIELDAGVRLLERSRTGVVTTEAGAAFAHHARLILRQHSQLQGELRDFGAGSRGTLTLYANTAALTGFLPRRLAPWLAQSSRVNLDLRERRSTEIVKMIGAGLAEAGVISDAINPTGVTVQPVASDHLVLIVPVAHRLAESKEVCFAEITDEQFVGLETGSTLQGHIEDLAAELLKTLELRVRMKTFEGLCQMVSEGVGVAIVPLTFAKRFGRRYPFKTIAISNDWARRQLCLCFQQWDTLSTPMRSLLAHLGGGAQTL